MKVEPFKFDDFVSGNWERFEYCPVCGQKYHIKAQNIYRYSECSNGHEWHFDCETGKVKKGKSPDIV